MNNKTVSVVIPSFNRAHVLNDTIPSYFQDNVIEVIVVNDASTDNTKSVLSILKSKYQNLVTVDNDINIKQTGSKNKGIEIARGDYIFFGDDDSILQPNAINLLMSQLDKYDVAGCRALYMIDSDQSIDECIRRHDKFGKFTCDLDMLSFEYKARLSHPVACNYTHACFMTRTDLARAHKFNTAYIGNAYREETDYLLSCYNDGATAVFVSDAVIVNLPPRLAAGGGARGKSKIMYQWYSFYNNWLFLQSNNHIINKLTGTNKSSLTRMSYFIIEKLSGLINKFRK